MQIGEKLKLLRKEKGLTQVEVGEAVGQERSTVACWETGKRTPDVATLEKLARLYKVTLDHFSSKSEADIMIELLARSNAFFSAQNISDMDKDKVYQDIMRLYLDSKNRELDSNNARKNLKTNTQREIREN